jgi:hypothetical protein
MLGELLDGFEVVADGGGGVITPLELLQHRVSEMSQEPP